MSSTTNSRPLRAWQQQALAHYDNLDPNDYLATATPGAGKTTFALTLAQRLISRRVIDRVIVVVPTDQLRTQWADAAAQMGLHLDPTMKNSDGAPRPGANGYVTTYAQVALAPHRHAARTSARKTMVILDEIHHAGDSLSWGEAVQLAFDPARRRLALTGTPFRTKATERIPFVRYVEAAPGELVSDADFSYGYREALADAVVRPVVFAAYTGVSRWLNNAGEVLSASLSDPASRSEEDAAWRTALDPTGRWIPHVIAAADQRLSDVRCSGSPDAAGLMLATDQDTARAYAKILTQVTGHRPVVVLSDDPKSGQKIEAFRNSTQRWLIAVKQVSEGVDIARLNVCLWTTSYRTPLFFAQAVGRVVRARGPHETATVFLPAVRPLLTLAAELEEQRNYAVRITGPADGLDGLVVERVRNEPTGEPTFTALEADAEFAHVLHGGRAITSDLTPDDEEFLGLPGLLSPEQTAALLASRDEQLRKRVVAAHEDNGLEEADLATWRDVAGLRREVHQLVGQVAARTGRKHADVHSELRRVVAGPPSAAAPLDVLQARRDWLLSRVA